MWKCYQNLFYLKKWIFGIVIKTFKNPFIRDEIAIKDDLGRVFFEGKDFFKSNYSPSEIICEN